MKILSVDDRSENLYLLESLLKAHGHEVTSVFNGVQALAHLEQEYFRGGRFDVVITDILMPEMDGFQLCREVKSRPHFRNIPVIVYTATYTSRQDAELALSIGASRFMIKPADPDEFIQMLVAVLEENADSSADEPDGEAPGLASEDFLRSYNQRLVRKLERKVEQLESAGERLTALVAERDKEIARRRDAEERLRRSQEQLQLVWDNSIDGLLLVDTDGRVLKANPAFMRLRGLGMDEPLVSGPAPSWIFPLPAGEMEGIERPVTRPDGSEAAVEVTATTLSGAQGTMVFCLIRDVTESKRKEAERAALEADLAEARKLESLGRLAGGIAHDFNNLLTVINGYSEMALRKTEADSPHRDAILQIRDAGGQAAELTGQLLAFSRRHQAPDVELDLNDVIARTVPMLQRLIGDHIRIVTVLDQSLGRIRGSVNQIIQILMNLAANARDAMPGGGTLRISTSNAESTGLEATGAIHARSLAITQCPAVALMVHDTGAGIHPEVLPHIFEPFFTTKTGEGTGIGLFTVAGIVQRGGGVISVRTREALGPGGGTEFRIVFPRVDSEREAAVEIENDAPPVERSIEGGTVLVVDDRDDVRRLVAAQLDFGGYCALEAASGEEALRVATEYDGPIDVLLTDLLMPSMDGRELADRMRTLRPDIRILFMSGNPGDENAAGDGPRCILKPFREAALARAIRETLTTPPRSLRLSRGAGA